MKRMILVDNAVLFVYHTILVLSLYFLFAGHNQPGGGFAGGLLAGAALSLRFLAGGMPAVRAALPVRSNTLLGSGLLIAVVCALVPILLGGGVLEHASFSLSLPIIGTLKATTALPFDIGVYLLVVGMAMAAFDAFGDDHDAVTANLGDPLSDTVRDPLSDNAEAAGEPS